MTMYSGDEVYDDDVTSGPDPYDVDDRVRCTCHHLSPVWVDGKPTGKDAKAQCLNSTRHPSGLCADCRTANGVAS